MIKNLGSRKLGRTSAHKRSMLRNMATSLFKHEKVTTTLPKAKELVSYSEKLITKAMPGDLNAKRSIACEIKDKTVIKKMFDVLISRYEKRRGGYTRILRVGVRPGDNAKMAIVKLVD